MSRLVLGVDPAYRTFGYCLVKVNGTPELVAHGLVDLGNSKEWRTLIPKAIDVLHQLKADAIAVEEIVWQGRRKGALALAHLAGAVIGWAASSGMCARLYQPRDVKAATEQGKFPPNFSDHERDAMSLCRLYLNDEELADKSKTTKRTTSRRSKRRS